MSGKLTPGRQPTPQNACKKIPRGSVALLLGNSGAAYTNSFPHSVIEAGNEKILVIDRKNNRITISAGIYSRDNRIIAELKDNQFYINPNNYFRIERPDNHSLIVYDQEGNQAINVNFLNPSAIELSGKFYLPNQSPISIQEDSLIFMNNKFSQYCFGGRAVTISLPLIPLQMQVSPPETSSHQ